MSLILSALVSFLVSLSTCFVFFLLQRLLYGAGTDFYNDRRDPAFTTPANQEVNKHKIKEYIIKERRSARIASLFAILTVRLYYIAAVNAKHLSCDIVGGIGR